MGLFNEIEDEVTVIGDVAVESEITLLAIMESCDSEEEFVSLMENLATEMAIYNVISDADVAMEAVKKIVIKDYNKVKRNKIQARTALRLAEKQGDPLYAKYKKQRTLMRESKGKILTKYASKAKAEYRKILKNAKNKASGMASGKSISNKIDSAIAGATKGQATTNGKPRV